MDWGFYVQNKDLNTVWGSCVLTHVLIYDLGFYVLTEDFKNWVRISKTDWGFYALTENFKYWLRILRTDWGSTFWRSMPGQTGSETSRRPQWCSYNGGTQSPTPPDPPPLYPYNTPRSWCQGQFCNNKIVNIQPISILWWQKY